MNSYLFLWKSENWSVSHFDKSVDELTSNGVSRVSWKVQSYRKIQIGDRAFIMRTGNEQGIFASGFIASEPYDGPYFKDPAQLVKMVDIDLDTLLHPQQVSNLSLRLLKQEFPNVNWTPYQSGVQLPQNIVNVLETIWNNFNNQSTVSSPFEESFFEGTVFQQTINSYERNINARNACLKHYGHKCSVCQMDFERVYGEIGRNFIHVHHINELADNIGRFTDPILHLRPVCPNCHAMLHRKKPAISLEELKVIMVNQKQVD